MNTEPTLRPSVVVSLTAVIAPYLPTCRTISVCCPPLFFPRAAALAFGGWVGGSVGGGKWISEKEKKEVVSPFLPFLFRLPCVWGKRRALIPPEVDNNKGYLYKHWTAAEMRASRDRGIVRT